MKFYLSSYGIGDEANRLKDLVPDRNIKTAYISNALDFSNDFARRVAEEVRGIEELKGWGLDAEILDLRGYFNKREALLEKLKEFGAIWVCGGNIFVLRQAMKLSGFDLAMEKLINTDILYGGFSSGACVLSLTLRGFDLVDDASIMPYEGQKDAIWDGLMAIDYSIVPHYKSDHPESEKMNDVVDYMIKNKILFKALRDGEVIIIE